MGLTQELVERINSRNLIPQVRKSFEGKLEDIQGDIYPLFPKVRNNSVFVTFTS